MGGFLSALGAALSGAGQQAGPFRDRENEHMFQAWEQTKNGLLQTLADVSANVHDDTTKAELWKARTDISKLLPGQDPSKHIQKVLELTSLHPVAASALAPPEPKTAPGIAPPGQVPGLPVIQPPPVDEGMAAQPATSPVQGGQIGGQINITAPMPTGSGSPTYDALTSRRFWSPADLNAALPVIQNEMGTQRDMLKIAAEAEAKRLEEQQRVHNTGQGQLVQFNPATGKAEAIYTAPKPVMSVGKNTRVFDPNTNKTLLDAAPEDIKWEVKTSTDNAGNVWQWRVDPMTGTTTERVSLGHVGKANTPGTVTIIRDDYGNIKGGVNFKTGQTYGVPDLPGQQPGETLRTQPLPPAELNRRSLVDTTLKQLPRMYELALKHPEVFGQIKGRATQLQSDWLGNVDPEITELLQLSNTITENFARAREGAVIPDAMMRRLEKLVPSIKQPYSTFKSNFVPFQQQMRNLAAQSTGGKLGEANDLGLGQGTEGGFDEEWIIQNGKLVKKGKK